MPKPHTKDAMKQLTETIRQHIPFDELDEARVCSGLCIGCPKKLLEYLEQEVEYWEQEIRSDNSPTLGNVQKLAKSSQKIYQVLDRTGILNPDTAD